MSNRLNENISTDDNESVEETNSKRLKNNLKTASKKEHQNYSKNRINERDSGDLKHTRSR